MQPKLTKEQGIKYAAILRTLRARGMSRADARLVALLFARTPEVKPAGASAARGARNDAALEMLQHNGRTQHYRRLTA